MRVCVLCVYVHVCVCVCVYTLYVCICVCTTKLYSFQVSYCIRDHATPEVKKRQVTEAIRISPWYHSTVEG